MPHSTSSSSASATCGQAIEACGGRFEWRPSRWLVAAQVLLGVLAAVSVLNSALPAPLSLAMALVACGWGLASAWRLARQGSRSLQWPRDGSAPDLDGETLAGARLYWRGSLAFLRWRDRRGRMRHLSWWPDTLPPAVRRELRLVAGGRGHPARPRSMAG